MTPTQSPKITRIEYDIGLYIKYLDIEVNCILIVFGAKENKSTLDIELKHVPWFPNGYTIFVV